MKDAILRFAVCCNNCSKGVKVLGVLIYCKKYNMETLPHQVCEFPE